MMYISRKSISISPSSVHMGFSPSYHLSLSLSQSAKMFNYARWKNACNYIFILFAAIFIVTRLIIFPFRYTPHPSLSVFLSTHTCCHQTCRTRCDYNTVVDISVIMVKPGAKLFDWEQRCVIRQMSVMSQKVFHVFLSVSQDHVLHMGVSRDPVPSVLRILLL